jgi:hypothetical protein
MPLSFPRLRHRSEVRDEPQLRLVPCASEPRLVPALSEQFRPDPRTYRRFRGRVSGGKLARGFQRGSPSLASDGGNSSRFSAVRRHGRWRRARSRLPCR